MAAKINIIMSYYMSYKVFQLLTIIIQANACRCASRSIIQEQRARKSGHSPFHEPCQEQTCLWMRLVSLIMKLHLMKAMIVTGIVKQLIFAKNGINH